MEPKTENCVVSVHLGYATPGLTEPSDPQHPLDPSDFHTLLDSDLYLPETTWDADPQRKAAARVPEEVTYRPMWQIALGQIDRALANGIRFGDLTFDEAYAKRKGFLEGLDERGQRYVAEIPRDLHLWTRRPAVLHEAPRDQAAGPGRPLSYPAAEGPRRGHEAVRGGGRRVVRSLASALDAVPREGRHPGPGGVGGQADPRPPAPTRRPAQRGASLRRRAQRDQLERR